MPFTAPQNRCIRVTADFNDIELFKIFSIALKKKGIT